MNPVILVTASILDDEKTITIKRAYAKSIEKAGGIAIIPDCENLSSVKKLLKISDGILLTGGVDIDPIYYGESPIKEIGEITPLRDIFEIELTKQAIKLNKPIFAICRGVQLLNIVFGGTLYQDIYTQHKGAMKHSQEQPRHCASHEVKIIDNSLLKAIVKSSSIRVNSFHHQAVKDCGKGMKITATSDDGIIEAIENDNLGFCLGVQWHPEHMTEKSPEQHNLFKEFINAAKNLR